MVSVNAYKGNQDHIFISYAHKDADVVMLVIERMISDGFRVWYDEGIEPGSDWDEFIATQIDNSGCFIALLSENYLESDNCKDELNYARDHVDNIILVYLDDVKLPKGMELRLGRNQAIFAKQYPKIEDFLTKLYSSQNINNYRDYVAPIIEIEKEVPQKELPVPEVVKTNKKKIIIPISIIAGALVVACIVGFVIYNVFGKTDSRNNHREDRYNPLASRDTRENAEPGFSGTRSEFNSANSLDDKKKILTENNVLYLMYLSADTIHNDDIVLEQAYYLINTGTGYPTADAVLNITCDGETTFFIWTIDNEGEWALYALLPTLDESFYDEDSIEYYGCDVASNVLYNDESVITETNVEINAQYRSGDINTIDLIYPGELDLE